MRNTAVDILDLMDSGKHTVCKDPRLKIHLAYPRLKIHLACCAGRQSEVKYLLANKGTSISNLAAPCDVEGCCRCGDTPLVIAAKKNNTECLRLLIAAVQYTGRGISSISVNKTLCPKIIEKEAINTKSLLKILGIIFKRE